MGDMDTENEDPVMVKVRKLIEESGLTYQQIGEKMGYGPDVARQAVSQFLKTGNPRIDRLRRFAEAFKMSLSALVK